VEGNPPEDASEWHHTYVKKTTYNSTVVEQFKNG